MNKHKIGLVGFGRIGKMHAKNIVSDCPNVEIAAIVDSHDDAPNKKWMAQHNIHCPISSDLGLIIDNKEIETVVIAASTEAHVDIIKAIVPKKKYIFCEKPVSLESKKIKEVEELLKKNNTLFQVGFNRRFDHQFQMVKKAVEQGKVGNLYLIKITNRDPYRPPVKFIPKSGGLIRDFNSHDFDMVRFISEKSIEEVTAVGANLVDKKIGELGDIDTVLITLRLKDGSLATIDCCRETLYGYDQELEAFGSKGSVKAHNLRENTLSLSTRDGVSIAKPFETFVERYRDAYRYQIISFFDCIQKKTKPPVGIQDIFLALCVAEAANLSLQKKQTVTVNYKV